MEVKTKKGAVNINIGDEDVTDEVKEQLKNTGKAHIHKTGDKGEEIDIDIDKKKKKVDINIDDKGDKKKVNISLSGVKVKSEDGSTNVNIRFLPIIIGVAIILFGVLFFFYKIIELIIGSIL
tara:strand:+ start:1141 stop:1506 length:366 start_codon:yes stop_codon:yes gene_type:complete